MFSLTGRRNGNLGARSRYQDQGQVITPAVSVGCNYLSLRLMLLAHKSSNGCIGHLDTYTQYFPRITHTVWLFCILLWCVENDSTPIFQCCFIGIWMITEDTLKNIVKCYLKATFEIYWKLVKVTWKRFISQHNMKIIMHILSDGLYFLEISMLINTGCSQMQIFSFFFRQYLHKMCL